LVNGPCANYDAAFFHSDANKLVSRLLQLEYVHLFNLYTPSLSSLTTLDCTVDGLSVMDVISRLKSLPCLQVLELADLALERGLAYKWTRTDLPYLRHLTINPIHLDPEDVKASKESKEHYSQWFLDPSLLNQLELLHLLPSDSKNLGPQTACPIVSASIRWLAMPVEEFTEFPSLPNCTFRWTRQCLNGVAQSDKECQKAFKSTLS